MVNYKEIKFYIKAILMMPFALLRLPLLNDKEGCLAFCHVSHAQFEALPPSP